MKYSYKITLILVALFFIAHVVGLFVTNEYLEEELPYGIERPELEESTSYIPLLIAILIATGLVLLLVKIRAMKLWKVWFIFATVYLLGIAFSAFLTGVLALILAIGFGLWKFFKPNVYVHNFVELFVYSGIAAIFAPVMGLLAVSILLILVSIYDYIAVWKIKHMVTLAKFQLKAKLFAGLLVPVENGKRSAILGGGDIGFTLLFSGVVLVKLGFLQALIVSLATAIALFLLFMYSKKNKFYPAMPFLSAGCFLGLLISLLI